jgi:hypothetical protein
LPKTLDADALRAAANIERFRSFERDIEEAIERESDERRRKIQEAKRAREKRARKKRLKAQAALRS